MELDDFKKLMGILKKIDGVEIKTLNKEEFMEKMLNMDNKEIKLRKKVADAICDKIGKDVFEQIAKHHMDDDDSDLKQDWVMVMGILCNLFHKQKIMLKGRREEGDKSSDE